MASGDTLVARCSMFTRTGSTYRASGRGWTSTPVLTGFIVAAILLSAFVVHEKRCGEKAMLPLPLLRLPGVARGAVSLAPLSFSMYGALFVITLYLQGVLGYTPWQAGLRTLPLAAALAAGSLAAPRLLAAPSGRPARLRPWLGVSVRRRCQDRGPSASVPSAPPPGRSPSTPKCSRSFISSLVRIGSWLTAARRQGEGSLPRSGPGRHRARRATGRRGRAGRTGERRSRFHSSATLPLTRSSRPWWGAPVPVWFGW